MPAHCLPTSASRSSPLPFPPSLQIVLSSDEEVFGGYTNVSKKYDAEIHTEVSELTRMYCWEGICSGESC